MKRYLLFAGVGYYPYGGWKDYVGSYDSIEEATKGLAKRAMEQMTAWYHIVDSVTGMIVDEG